MEEIFIPQILKDITVLDLTLAGQIDLMGFDLRAIEEANKVMLKKRGKTFDDRWRYYLGICNKWHKENNVEIRHDLVRNLFKKHSIADNSPRVLSNDAIYTPLEINNTPADNQWSKTSTEFTRRPVVMHHENKHTDEEYRKIREYHQKLRPHEYVTAYNGEISRRNPKLTLEEELALPLERREQIIAKLDADWESPNGEAFKKLVGLKDALALYGRLRMQLMTGKLYPEQIAPVPAENTP